MAVVLPVASQSLDFLSTPHWDSWKPVMSLIMSLLFALMLWRWIWHQVARLKGYFNC